MTEGSRSGETGAGGASGRRRRRRRRSGGAESARGKAGESVAAAAAGSGGATGKRGGRTRGGRKRSAEGTAQPSRGVTGGRKRSGTKVTGTKGASAKRSTRGRTATRAAGARRTGSKAAKTTSRRRAPKVPTKREVSAGGVVYRRDDDGIEIVLASRRTRRGQLAWGLAKGGIEDGESMEQAAIREVREETGLEATIESSLGETRYFYVWEDVRIRKTVHFYLMRHTGGDVEDRDDEMEEIRWFPLERALKRAAYRGERDVLKRAAELLR